MHFDREKGEFIGLDDKIRAQLNKSYPDKDIDGELKKMAVWLQSPRGKKHKGALSFVTKWLDNANVNRMYIKETPAPPKMNNYLEKLWKNCSHLLEFNQIQQ